MSSRVVSGARPLLDMSEDELRVLIRANSRHVAYSINDMVTELDRRAARRQARASFVLSVVGLLIAVAALVVTALKA